MPATSQRTGILLGVSALAVIAGLIFILKVIAIKYGGSPATQRPTTSPVTSPSKPPAATLPFPKAPSGPRATSTVCSRYGADALASSGVVWTIRNQTSGSAALGRRDADW